MQPLPVTPGTVPFHRPCHCHSPADPGTAARRGGFGRLLEYASRMDRWRESRSPSMRALRGLARGIAPVRRCACQRPGGGRSPGKCPAAHHGRGPLPITDLLVCGLPLRAGGGTATRVSWSRPHRRKRCHRCNGRGHRPCQSATLPLDQPRAKAPGQRPPRHRRALCTRRAGRWPVVGPGPAGLGDTVRRGRGKRGSRFLIPPGLAKALSPRHWQGPLPLPQRHAGIRTDRGPKPPGQRPTRPPAGAGLAYVCRTGSCGSAVPDRAGPVATGGAPAHPPSAATGPPVLSHCGLRQSGWTRSDSRTNTDGMPAGSGRGNPGAAPVPVPVPVKRSTRRDISA